jgi:hypothetical protein
MILLPFEQGVRAFRHALLSGALHDYLPYPDYHVIGAMTSLFRQSGVVPT